MAVCKYCQEELTRFERNICARCAGDPDRRAPKTDDPTSPAGEVTVTENFFGGTRFDPLEFERGIDEKGDKWVRCRKCGELSCTVDHSDQIGDGQRVHYTHSTYPWSDWTLRRNHD